MVLLIVLEYLKNKDLTYEQAMSRLESISDLLDNGEVSLDESISFFEESMELIKYCEDKLDDLKQKIEIIDNKGK